MQTSLIDRPLSLTIDKEVLVEWLEASLIPSFKSTLRTFKRDYHPFRRASIRGTIDMKERLMAWYLNRLFMEQKCMNLIVGSLTSMGAFTVDLTLRIPGNHIIQF
jgi:hypothetical protein